MSDTYTLTANIKKMLETRGFVLTCDRCKRSIMPGEKVVAKPRYGRVKRYRHEECYERMFVEV